MDYLSQLSGGLFDLDEITAGVNVTSPRADNSWGAPAMETHTPTGNGSGVFMDSSWQQTIFGGLSKVVDYAIQRDAIKMQMNQPYYQPATQQQVQVQGKQTNFLFLALCGLGIYLVAKK